jgi:hypothetical protein
MEPKKRLVTVTDAPLIRIHENEWPQVASGSAIEGRAKVEIYIYKHRDGRSLVWGKCEAASSVTEAGRLLAPSTVRCELVMAICGVAEDLVARMPAARRQIALAADNVMTPIPARDL